MPRTIAVPVDFLGGVSSRPSSKPRWLSGTTNSSASAAASDGSARGPARATASYKRCSATDRACDTCRTDTETPGSSAWFF
ncbi:hypothetical protein ACFTZM_38870, partial [Streptomyces hydrogenans]|uniref:hypothetical protein n=1 Tax=Streptomyces hydrogenans TaxID=1873719 RepID=UPI00362AB5DA